MKSTLNATDVSFAYAGTSVLRNVSLSLAPGEFVGLIGANGSGKTTLLRVLLGLLSPTIGEVRVGEAPIGSLSRREIALRATMVQQEARIDFAFTVREIVAMGRTPYLGRFKPESAADKDAIHRAMRATDTLKLADRSAMELSGGERQRVHVARALAQEVQAILLDEPTANLDLAHQLEILQLVANFTRQGKSALAAIHDLSLATRFCDRLLLLSAGEIVAAGKPADVVTEANLVRYFALRSRVRHVDEGGGLTVWPLSAIREYDSFEPEMRV
jgi:iron complex transport system ATP-binding protein